jgi:hypothetical protein
MQESKVDMLCYVPHPKHLHKLRKHRKIVEMCSHKLMQTPHWQMMRTNPNFLMLTVNLIENLVNEKKTNEEKKQLYTSILTELYTDLTLGERQIQSDLFDFLYDSGKVKRVKFYKKWYLITKDWLIKKIT